MSQVAGDALHWAVALSKAPGMRHVLRDRSLPDGIERLIPLAAGSAAPLAAAAHASGESEPDLRDAARFYLQEVLFFPQATAYRVLGVAPGDSADSIKRNHRLLQHWLHPDRGHGEWESAFAARVNWAWECLRSDARRSAYDSRLHEAGAVPTTSRAEGRLRMRGMPGAPTTGERWRARLPTLALLGACSWLVVLLARQGETVEWSDDAAVTRAATGGSDAPTADGLEGALSSAARHIADAGRGLQRQAPRPPRLEPAKTSVAAANAPATPVPAVAPHMAEVPTAPASTAVPPTASARATGTSSDTRSNTAASADPAIAPDAPPPDRAADRATALALAPQPAAGVAVETIDRARRCGEQLVQYLVSPGAPVPPIWSSLAAQDEAERLHRYLHEPRGRVRITAGEWRIGDEAASLLARYRRERAGVVEIGAARVTLAWREGRWLVQRIALEATQ